MELLNFQKEPSELSGLRLVAEAPDRIVVPDLEQQYVNFMFFNMNPEWRRLESETKIDIKREFQEVYDSFQSDLLLFSYSLVGFDSKADLMFWRIGKHLDLIQEMTAKLYRTRLGSFLSTADNYLSVTKRMMFVGEPSNDRRLVQAGTSKYHFFYPCSKYAEWHAVARDERDSMIEENFMVGRKFPNIKIHLTHSFGFSDQEYLISFETDEPRDFLVLAEELRETAASKFTMRGMPVYTCRRRSLMECLDALG